MLPSASRAMKRDRVGIDLARVGLDDVVSCREIPSMPMRRKS
jgi:hypothetical protein